MPDAGGRAGAPAARRVGRSSALVLEGQRNARAERDDLAFLQPEVHFRHLGDTQVAQGAARRLHGVARRIFPRLLADADDVDDSIDGILLGHVSLHGLDFTITTITANERTMVTASERAFHAPAARRGHGGGGPWRRVTLTFDNGPTPGITQRVLDVLARANLRATFF